MKISRHFDGPVLLCLFLFLLTLISGTYYVENSKTMVVTVFAGIAGIWLAVRSIRRREAVTVDLGALLLGGYFLWHMLTTMIGGGYDPSFYYAKAFGYFAVFLWARQLLRRGDLPLYLRVFPVVTVALGMVWLGGFLLTSQGLLHLRSITFSQPIKLTFGNQNYLGCFCAMSAPLMLSAALNEKSGLWRWLSGFGFLVAISIGLATQSRLTFTVIALVPAALILTDMVLLKRKGPHLAIAATAAFLLAYSTAGWLLQKEWIESDLATTFSSANTSDTEHLGIWRASWRMISEDSPGFLFGHGWGYLYKNIFTFPFESIGYPGLAKEFRYSHSEYLDICLEGGLVGLGLFLALVITTLMKLARITFGLENPREPMAGKAASGPAKAGVQAADSKDRRDRRAHWQRALAPALAGGIGAYLAFGLFDVSTRYTITQFPFIVLLVFAWVLVDEPLKVRAPAWSTVPLAVLAVYASWIGVRNFAADSSFANSVETFGRDPKTAAKWLDSALWWDPNHMEALTTQLAIAMNEVDLERGREYWKRLNDNIPQFEKAGKMYAFLLYQAHQFGGAVSAARNYIHANYYDIDGRVHFAIYLYSAKLHDDFSRQLGEIIRVYLEIYNLTEGERFQVRMTEQPEAGPVLEVIDGQPISGKDRYRYVLRGLGENVMDPLPETFSEARRRILSMLVATLQSDYGMTPEEFAKILPQ